MIIIEHETAALIAALALLAVSGLPSVVVGASALTVAMAALVAMRRK